jgi:hypothetical protein
LKKTDSWADYFSCERWSSGNSRLGQQCQNTSLGDRDFDCRFIPGRLGHFPLKAECIIRRINKFLAPLLRHRHPEFFQAADIEGAVLKTHIDFGFFRIVVGSQQGTPVFVNIQKIEGGVGIGVDLDGLEIIIAQLRSGR